MISTHQLKKINEEKVEDLYKYKSWSAEVYSFGKILRNYGIYPNFLPLYVTTDHGPSQSDEPTMAELNYSHFAHFYHSERLVEKFKKRSNKKCYTLISPYVWYRRKKKIIHSEKAKGTIVFPTHSTHHISIEKNWNEYIAKLLELPSKYHPISACIYFLDVKKGLHKSFEDAGIETFCAGTWTDPNFVDNFYNIIKNFKYASSATPGSYLFYCQELGLDFFIYGEKPVYVNKSDNNARLGRYSLDKKHNSQLESIKDIFNFFNSNQSEKQVISKYELGISGHAISRFKFSMILYLAFINNILSRLIKRIV
jgi:hypothetical protein